MMQSFSEQLRLFFNKDALGLLAEYILNGEMASYSAGGCRIAAKGLWRWVNATPTSLQHWECQISESSLAIPSHRLWTVADRWYHPKHVALQVEDCFLDAQGVSTREELLARYASTFPDPRLLAYNPARLTRYRIRLDEDMSTELAHRLAKTFGPFPLVQPSRPPGSSQLSPQSLEA